jgi:hypothetical protein
MQLSEKTISILRNFSDINQNILFKPGKKLATMSTMKNIMAKATIDEEFNQEFGIYDLPEFLRSFEKFVKPKLNFNGTANLKITDDASSLKTRYPFAEKSTLVAPTKDITMPDKTVAFSLKQADFDMIKGQYATLSLPDIAIRGKGGKVEIVALDKKNSNAPESSLPVGETNLEFTAYIKAENLKIIPGDYDVALSKAKIAHFINKKINIEYWIALETDSEF